MKTKVVLWGENAKNEKVLIALELRAEENMVDIYTIPESAVKEDFYRKMMDDWRDNKNVDFPDETEKKERPLSVTEGLLPEDLKTTETDLISRAQAEWHFAVLSQKLSKAYASELEDLKELVEKADKYQKDTWDRLKEFWGKVQGQVNERNLFRSHADELRNTTNELFEKMKTLRKSADEEFRKTSEEVMGSFQSRIDEVKQKSESGDRLRPLFDKLVALQREYREAKTMTREHRNKVWASLDTAFKDVKTKLFGNDGSSKDGAKGNSPLARTQRRYNGLLAAIEKMERSIKRDEDDLEFQNRRIKNSDGQLEAQIRQAKLKMIEERMNSKKAKLADMHKTKAELEQRIEKDKEREEKRKEREAKDAERKAKEAEAKAKIAEEMKAQQEAIDVDEDKLKAAAAAIKSDKVKATTAATAAAATVAASTAAKEENGLTPLIENAVEVGAAGINAADKEATEKADPQVGIVEEVTTMVSEAMEDVVDTAKAVASVIGDNVSKVVKDFDFEEEE